MWVYVYMCGSAAAIPVGPNAEGEFSEQGPCWVFIKRSSLAKSDLAALSQLATVCSLFPGGS